MEIFTPPFNLSHVNDLCVRIFRPRWVNGLQAPVKGHYIRTSLLFLIFISAAFTSAAQTIVTAPGNGQNICSNLGVGGSASGFTTLGDIVVTETNSGDFAFAGPALTLTLNAPSGWQFNTSSVLAYSSTGTNITGIATASGGLTSSSLTINVSGSGTTMQDAFTISGLQVQAMSTTSLNGDITASSSAGFNLVANSSFASLSLLTASAADVTISANPAGPVCAGSPVTFTASPTNGGTSPSYQWQINGLNVDGQTNSTFTTSDLANGNVVTVVMTSDLSCIVNNPVTSNQLSMTVNDIPAAPIASNSGPVCEGGTINLSTATVAGASYSWAGPNGFSSTDQNPSIASAVPAAAGVYSVTITLNGCTSPAGTTTVVVNPIPVTPSPGNNGPVCAGGTINLTTPTVTGATYSWTGPNNFTSSLQNPTIPSSTSAMAGDYRVTITVNGCTSSEGVTSVVVNALPPTPTASNSGAICAGSSINLSTPTVAGAIYSWTGPNGFTSTDQNPVITASTTAMAGAYSVTITLNGCTSLAGSTTVAVNAIPATPAASSNSPVCVGSPINLATPAVAGATYSWSGPNSFASTVQNPVIPNATIAMGGVYSVTITVNGCQSAAGNTTVVVNEVPVTPIVTSNSAVCAGGTINLSTAAVAGATYAWSGPNSFTSTAQNPSIANATAAMAGVYSLRVTVNGCTSPAGTTTFVVNPIPATPTASSNSPVCPGSPINLTTPAVSGATYSWIGPNGFTSSVQNPQITNASAAMAGTYNVIVTVNGCSSSAGSTSVIVNPTLVPSVTISASSTSICSLAGTPVTFTATPTNGGTSPSYQWQRNGSNIDGATGAVYTTTSLANPSSISVILTSNATCASPLTATSNSVAMTVYSSNVGNIGPNDLTGPLSICPVANNVTYSIAAVANAASYNWIFPAGWVINSGQGTRTVNVSATTGITGTVSRITVQAVNPCEMKSRTFDINIGNFAGVNAGIDQTICSSGVINLSAVLQGNASTVTWTAPSGTFSNVNSLTPTYTPAITSGSVTLTVTTNAPVGSCPPVAGTDQVVVTVNQPVAITTQPVASQTLCSGGTATFSVAATGTGATYQWQKAGVNIPGATLSTLTLNNITTGDAGNYTVRVSGTSPCTPVTSSTSALVVNQAVAINTQPVATQTVCSGGSVSFTVAATGTGLSYQWRRGTTNIAGATSATLTINSAAVADAGNDYNVVITGTSPCSPLTSGNATLVVNEVVSITTQPVATQTLCSGSAASFSVTATGTGLSYQWRKGGANIPGATSSTLTLNNINTGDSGEYSVIVTGSGPCTSVTSTTSTLVVNQVVAISTQPVVSQTACSGSAVSFTVVATGTGLSYQWRRGTTNIAGATAATLTISSVAAGDAGSDYNVVVTGTGPCTPLTSNNAALVVNEVVAITTQPAATQTICSGSSVSFTVAAAGTGATYQWRRGTTNIAGATLATLTINSATSSDADTDYNVVITGTSPCTPITSSNAALVVNQVVAITTQPAATQSVCSSFPVSFTVAATGTGLTYQWYRDGNIVNNVSGVISGATSATLNISQAAVSHSGIYTVVVTGAAPCAPVTSASAQLTVNQSIAITTQPVSQTICESGNVSFTVAASGSIASYVWRRNGTPIPPGGNYSGQNTATLTITGALTANSGNYDVVVSGPGGSCSQVLSGQAALAVNPLTVAGTVSGGTTVCSGTNSSVLTLSGYVGAILRWESSLDNFVTAGVSIANTTTTLTASNLTANTSYRAVVQSGVCAPANSAAGTISVTPVSAGGSVAGAATVCSGTNSTTLTLSGHTGSVVRWESSLNNFATAGTAITISTNTLTVSNITATTSYRAVVQSGTCPTANSLVATVSVDPVSAGGTVAGGTTVCSGTNSTVLTLSGHTGNVVRWESSLDNFATAGTAISNTTNTFTASNLGATTSYRAVVQSGSCALAPSAVATVATNPVSAGGTISGGTTVCSGTNSTVLTLSGHTGNIIRWESSIDNFATAGVSIANTTTTLTAANLATTTSYRAIVQSGACSPTNSLAATVNVTPVSAGGTIAGAANVCSGTNSSTLTLSGHTGTVVRWESSLDNFVTAASPISNSATTTLTVANITATTYYRAVVGNGVCSPVNSGTASVTVNPVSAGGTIGGGATVCAGTNSTVLTLSGQTGSVVRWESSLDNFATAGTPIANTTNTFTASNLSATTSYRAVVQSGSCVSALSAVSMVTVNPVSVGGTLAPAIVSGCQGIDGTLTLSGTTGIIVRWESSINGGTTWTPIANTTTSLGYNDLQQTTMYRAVLQSGACAISYSSRSVISVIPPFNPVTTASPTAICIGGSSVLTSTSGYPVIGIADTSGAFSNANPKGWRRDGQSTGDFLPASRDNTKVGPWGETNGPKVFSGITYDGAGGKFAVVDGPDGSLLETPVFSLIAQNSSLFEFSQAFNLQPGARAIIEISTDGGATYTADNILAQYPVPSTYGITGSTGVVQPVTGVSLANYIGLSNLRIRFRYIGTTGSSWALDDVRIPGALPITYAWTSNPSYNFGDPTTGAVTVSPDTTTTYILTTYVGGCAVGTSSVTVTVNPLPTIIAARGTGGTVITCNDPAAQTTPLPYETTNLTTGTYSITWSVAASAYFANVVNAAITPTSIGIAVPAGVPAGTYTGTISVRNSNGCSSVPSPFSLVVNPLPTLATVTAPSICSVTSGTTITITLTGLLPNSISNIQYTIGGGTAVSVNGINADASGTGSFDLSVTPANNSQILAITSITTTTAANALACTIVPTVNSTLSLSVFPGFIWTGLAKNGSGAWDNAWSLPANWLCGVPEDGDNVIIPEVSNGNFPRLDVDFISNDFDLQGNVTIELDGHTLTLGLTGASDIRDSGWIIGSRASSLVVIGTLTQGLKFVQPVAPAVGTTNALLNFTVNSAGQTVNLSNSLWVIGNANPTAGIINSAGNLTMVSTATTSSNITETIAPADVLGVVNVQSYVSGQGATTNFEGGLTNVPTRGFVSMSSPINDALIDTPRTYRQMQKYIIITGPGGVTNGFDQGGVKQPYAETITTYNEAAAPFTPSAPSIQTIHDLNVPTRGFLAFFRGSQEFSYANNSDKLNEPFVTPDPVTITFSGIINKFNLSPTVLSHTNYGDRFDGFNLIGNPYPSAINWLDLYESRTGGVLNTFMIVLPGGKQASYLGGVFNNLNTTFIQPAQGFYAVTTTNGATLTFTEGVKTKEYPVRLLTSPKEVIMSAGKMAFSGPDEVKGGPKRILKLRIEDDLDYDETTLVFQEGGSMLAGYDDALYMSAGRVSLSSLSSEKFKIAINGMPGLEEVKEVRLSVNAKNSGPVKLNFMDLSQAQGFEVYLKDSLLGVQVDVKANPVYSFSIDKGKAETYGDNRFKIIFKKEEMLPLQLKAFDAKKQGDGVGLSWVIEASANASEFEIEQSADGKTFHKIGSIRSQGNKQGDEKYHYTDKDPVPGMNYYRVRLIHADGRVSLSEIKSIDYAWYGKDKNLLAVYPNPSIDNVEAKLTVQPEDAVELNVFDMHGKKVLSAKFSENEPWRYDVSKLEPSIYIVEISSTTNNRVLGRTKFVKGF